MAARSRFQLVNRGTKWRACWTVEDNGRHVFSSSTRSIAEGHLKLVRRLDRERAAKLAAGFHLPGL